MINQVQSIPKLTLLEKRPPVLFASRLALREGNSKKPIYQIHKWWARRLGSVFRTLLISATRRADSKVNPKRAFYSKQNYSGLVVLDPFVGGGTSVVEAAKCQASIIGVDIDPVACFVTRSELQTCDKRELEAAFEVVSDAVKKRIANFYFSTLGDGSRCSVVYAFWVEIVRCAKCKLRYEAHPHYQLRRDQKNRRQIVFCQHCGEIDELALRRRRFQCEHCDKLTEIGNGPVQHGSGICPGCKHEQPLTNSIKRQKPRHSLFALQVVDEHGKIHFKKASDADLMLYAKAQRAWAIRQKIDVFVPDESIPEEGRVDPRPISLGYKRYRDLFNCRQLLSLSLVAEAIAGVKSKTAGELLATAFSDCLASNNMFCYYAFDYQKLTPLFGLHAYHRVIRPVENNVWGTSVGRGSFERCYRKLMRGKEFARSPYEYDYKKSGGRPSQVRTGESISVEIASAVPSQRSEPFGVVLNTSSERLTDLGTHSVDLVLSDPPYYDNLAYSELSDFFHVWLKRLGLDSYTGNDTAQTPITKSLYVRTKQASIDREHEGFRQGLAGVLKECNRVLKNDGMMVFTFHHRSEAAWNALGDALIDASFKITNVFPVRSEGQSQFHSSDGNLKWDAVCCCRKRGDESYKSVVGTQKLVGQRVRSWKGRIRAGKLDFGTADELNLRRALCMMYRCNAGIYSGGHKQ